jgi:putative oxidoreductase
MIDQTTAPYAAFALRISLGVMFISHALLKVLVFTVPGTVAFFQSAGLPGALAYPVIAVELTAGVLLIAGVATRWVALATLPVLLGAAWVHFPNGWVFNTQGGGWEYPVFLAVAAAVQALLGDGAFALSPKAANNRPLAAHA